MIAPVLLSAWPILFLVSHNFRDLGLEEPYVRGQFLVELAWTLLLSAGGAMATFAAFAFLLRDAHKGATLASVAVVLFFAFGHVYDWLNGRFDLDVRLRALIGVWLLAFGAAAFGLWRIRRPWDGATRVLTAVASVLVLLPATAICLAVAAGPATPAPGPGPDVPTTLALSPPEGTPPSIYYIILDGYGSAEIFSELGYDNSGFVHYLESRNFTVIPDAHSNYAQTALSLPSTLNFRYLDPGREFHSFAVEARDNEALNALKALGYHFVNFANPAYAGTINRGAADTFVPCGSGTEFLRVLSQTTALRAWSFEQALQDHKQREFVTCAFDALERAGSIPGPKFVLAHILLPHPPYVFGPAGERVTLSEDELRQPQWTLRDRYFDHVAYVNLRMETIVDHILANEDQPPIIVIQGDHGPLTTTGKLDQVTNESIRERMSILNAYHLPDGGAEKLHDGITPVNTFRVIFGHYFNASLHLLEDRSYYSTDEAPMRFIDVTDAIRSPRRGDRE